MSQTIISIERVNSVESHPNADRLDIIHVLGYQVVTQKGSFEVGDFAVYFPPDILLPPDQAKELGVAPYLKHAVFPGDEEKTQCRVGAARLRGVPSHGFCSPASKCDTPVVAGTEIGTDVTSDYGAEKYVSPVRVGAGNAEPELESFHKYTNIENIQRYPDVIAEGEDVVITEKLHGTNCRLGLVRDQGEYRFCAGSHNVRRKEPLGASDTSLYWEFMTQKVMDLLSDLANAEDGSHHDAIIFCEIFGPGVQDLDYGQTEKVMRVFDISVDGIYMNYNDLTTTCAAFEISVVPILYRGPLSSQVVEEHTYGNTTFDGVRNKFKGREGCVIRPLTESFSDVLGGRLILKSVSADYRDRKGATDVE